MRYLTAGESHGPELTTIIEGVPAGLTLSVEAINQELARRQGGWSRWPNEDRKRPGPYHIRRTTWEDIRLTHHHDRRKP